MGVLCLTVMRKKLQDFKTWIADLVPVKACSAKLSSIAFRPLSIRSQVLLAVNVPLAVVATLFLAYGFHREMSDHVVER